MKLRRILPLLLVTPLVLAASVTAADPETNPKPLRSLTVSTVSGLQTALDQARPGDLIELADGDYQTSRMLTIDRSGTAQHPIVVRARHLGASRITGRFVIQVRGAAYVVIEGLAFAHEAAGGAVQVRGCHHVRITRNQFRLLENTAVRAHWVSIDGAGSHHNHVDHNLFENKRNSGCYLVTGGSAEPDFASSQYDQIDHNYFCDRPPGKGNGYESIRLGVGQLAHSSGFMTVEYNLFERCDGEAEIVSVKTCDQTIRFNTFLNCRGMLTFRNGHRNSAEGNFFLCMDKKQGSQGIRLYGDDHRVFNNYFCGLDGAAILLLSGDMEGPRKPVHLGGATGGYLRPRRATIAFNTAIDCRGGCFLIGDKRPEYPLQPVDCTIANNLASNRQGSLVIFQGAAGQMKWSGNILYSPEQKGIPHDVPAEGFRALDPKLVFDGSVWRLSADTLARDAAVGLFPAITTDMDGQPRDGKPDIGADEYSAFPAVRRPLTPTDVGVNGP